MDKSTVMLEYDFGFGLEEVDSHPSNPIQVALTNFIGSGFPILDHTFCFVVNGSSVRWLGVFVLSEGDRIVFFPGMETQISWFQTTYRWKSTPRIPFWLEHFTFEPSRKRWHFTSHGRKKHQAAGKVPNNSDDLFLWLGLSVSSITTLREVRRFTQISYEIPDSDLERRMSILGRVETDGANCLISLTENDPEDGRYFPHFLFAVGTSDSPLYGGSNYLRPFGSPNYVSPFPTENYEQQIFRHRITLGGRYDIQVFSMKEPGELTLPMVVTSHAN